MVDPHLAFAVLAHLSAGRVPVLVSLIDNAVQAVVRNDRLNRKYVKADMNNRTSLSI